MDYNKIVQGILDIGEAMLQSGAENFRLEDSFYRMCRSYGFKRSDVFVIPSNIQVTVETPEGEIITQIRHIESSEPNFDQLDYLTICADMSVSIHRMKKRCERNISKSSIVNRRSELQDMQQESWVEPDLRYSSAVTSGMRLLH